MLRNSLEMMILVFFQKVGKWRCFSRDQVVCTSSVGAFHEHVISWI